MSELLDPDPPRRIVTRRTAVGALVILAVVVGLLLLPDTNSVWLAARERLDSWEQAVAENTLLSVAIFFVVYVAVLTPPVPLAAVFALIGGALFGPWLGLAVLSAASVTAAALAFLIARYLLHDWAQRTLGHRLRRLNEGVAQAGGVYLLALRWVPFVPFFVINMGMALTPIRLGKYVVVSALAMAPLTALYAYAGSRVRELHTPRDAVRPEFLIAFGLLAVVPIGLKFLVRRMLRRREGVAVAVR